MSEQEKVTHSMMTLNSSLPELIWLKEMNRRMVKETLPVNHQTLKKILEVHVKMPVLRRIKLYHTTIRSRRSSSRFVAMGRDTSLTSRRQ